MLLAWADIAKQSHGRRILASNQEKQFLFDVLLYLRANNNGSPIFSGAQVNTKFRIPINNEYAKITLSTFRVTVGAFSCPEDNSRRFACCAEDNLNPVPSLCFHPK